jgi:S1-C subfamily serine protease
MKDAKDLPVSQLANENDMINGKSIIAYGWNRESSILNISSKTKQKIYSSDIVNVEYSFSGDLSTTNEKIFAYDLAGKFIGFVNKENKIFPVYNLHSALNGILKKGKISRIRLGVFYIDLSNYISRSDKIKGSAIAKNTDGVALTKNSPAFLAGLKENDIITHVNNIEINETSNLNILIQKYKPGDTVNLVYDRAGEKNNLNIILDEY